MATKIGKKKLALHKEKSIIKNDLDELSDILETVFDNKFYIDKSFIFNKKYTDLDSSYSFKEIRKTGILYTFDDDKGLYDIRNSIRLRSEMVNWILNKELTLYTIGKNKIFVQIR